MGKRVCWTEWRDRGWDWLITLTVGKYNCNMRTSLRIYNAVLLSLFLALGAAAQQPDYVVSQRLRLTVPANGVNGWLEVLTDSRLTPKLQKEMWGVGDWSFVYPETDPAYVEFKVKPPRNAQLRISSDDVRQQGVAFPLERPLARVTKAQLIDGKSSFLVAVDYSIGFGSYAGVTTQILDVSEGQFRWILATNVNTKEVQPIRLPETLKSAWRLVQHRQNKDILWVYCRPAKVAVAGREFVTGYVRYRFDGQHWVKYERLQNRMWESDEPFPAVSSFP
jgi:hypothetical protein